MQAIKTTTKNKAITSFNFNGSVNNNTFAMKLKIAIFYYYATTVRVVHSNMSSSAGITRPASLQFAK